MNTKEKSLALAERRVGKKTGCRWGERKGQIEGRTGL